MSKHEKESHQTKALFLKNLKLQSRQPCTNLCQILTPIICLIFTILIRKIAVENLPDNNDSIFVQFPMLPMKFNDFSLEDLLPDYIDRRCQQWYNFHVSNELDREFVGNKDSIHYSSGLLSKISNTYKDPCLYNLSYASPFNNLQLVPPVFLHSSSSVNEQIMRALEYFNNISDYDTRHTSAIDKIPDGSVTFISANQSALIADLKINDERILDYHRIDGITRIRFKSKETEKFNSYYLIPEGLLTLQHIITSAYIEKTSNSTFSSGIMYMPFITTNSIIVDLLVSTVTTILFPISLSLLLPVFLYLIVLEKEEKLIQMMRMNGMKMRVYWFVNFLFNFAISLITNFVFFGFGYIFMDNPLFTQTGLDVLIVVLLGWILAQIGMATFFQVFLASSRAANIIGYLISIWTNLIGATLSIALYQFPRELPKSLLLYPTFAFNRIFYLIFTECEADKCFNRLSALSSEAVQCIVVLYCSFIVFQTLGMYLYEVVPQEFGTRQPLAFPFYAIKKAFIKSKEHKFHEESIERYEQNQDDLAKEERKKIRDVMNETDYPLILSGLRKIYSNGKVAVKGMDLIMQDKEVFGLLGPNGAGKTTLISMITGVFEPSSGDCTIGGHSIIDDIEQVHLHIGVCPQFDILWPELTVEEHLYFYTRLRGTKTSEEKEMVEKALQEVNLTNFRSFKSSQLSGGMKRRLSVGISMAGNPRIVFLDEPTTGLDPENRRHLWEVLHKCRESRALFLTTHLMEEADALCNRIGVITQGVLRTVGTQQKLKKTYGNGYHLSLNLEMQKPKTKQSFTSQTLSEDDISSSIRTESIMSYSGDLERNYLSQTIACEKINKAKTASVIKEVEEAFPEAKLERAISGYLRFNLGNIVISEVMKKLSESHSDDIQNNWGLTNSTLEDVFLQVVNKFEQIDTINLEYAKPQVESLLSESSASRFSIQEES